MKKLRTVLLALSALVTVSTFAQAEPPSHYHLKTVRWVISTKDNLNVDDRYVTLIGQVTKKDGSDYWFTDGTGWVRLDSDDNPLPIGPKILIGGRIDQAYLGIGHLEVDVQKWHVVK